CPCVTHNFHTISFVLGAIWIFDTDLEDLEEFLNISPVDEIYIPERVVSIPVSDTIQPRKESV
ncbi:MAG: hypothetical protein ABS892_02085, partial [Psychrobacillus sp.]